MDGFVLVVNPRAGAGRAKRRLSALTEALAREGARFEVRETEGPRDATRIVRAALAEGAEGIAAVGGDGTLHECVNGFFDDEGRRFAREAWLGVLPAGTGGDFRRTLGLGADPEGAVRRMLAAKPRPIDVGSLEYERPDGSRALTMFVNIASFGLSGLVVDLVNDSPKFLGGRASFVLGTLRAMARYRNQKVALYLDDAAPRITTVQTVAIANGQYFGGGMHIAPNAVLDDGLFDVTILEDMTPIEALRLTRATYDGSLLSQRKVASFRASVVRAEPLGTDTLALDVDGETPGRLPATFRNRAGALLLRA
jgi:YegS/Rv2252/BmrU family lipid kinase